MSTTTMLETIGKEQVRRRSATRIRLCCSIAKSDGISGVLLKSQTWAGKLRAASAINSTIDIMTVIQSWRRTISAYSQGI